MSLSGRNDLKQIVFVSLYLLIPRSVLFLSLCLLLSISGSVYIFASVFFYSVFFYIILCLRILNLKSWIGIQNTLFSENLDLNPKLCKFCNSFWIQYFRFKMYLSQIMSTCTDRSIIQNKSINVYHHVRID